jgi:hypothetical protein
VNNPGQLGGIKSVDSQFNFLIGFGSLFVVDVARGNHHFCPHEIASPAFSVSSL